MQFKKGGVCIFASSSAVYNCVKTCNQTIRSILKKLLGYFTDFRILPDSDAVAKFLKQQQPTLSIEEVNEIVEANMSNFLFVQVLDK